GAPPDAALEIALELVSGALQDALTQGMRTLFARPQGQDRIWVRQGFIPVPEAELPAPLRGRPGAGLFGWRRGTPPSGAAPARAGRPLPAASREAVSADPAVKLVALAGGTGAAKLLRGLVRLVEPGDLTVIVNTGDDTRIWGLHISPDLDTVAYTLAGRIDE